MPSAVSTFAAIRGNGRLLRVLAAWVLFVVQEYAAWTAVLVWAYLRGGAAEAATAAVAQLVPAALCAPWLATVADRRSPSALLAWSPLHRYPAARPSPLLSR